jgi:fucose 4-O-acetylase-like acetyltransferase
MSLFFFISGYLEKNRKIKETLQIGLKTIIIPYLLLYCLDYFWWFSVSLLRHPEIFGEISLDNALIKPFLGMIFGVGYNTEFSMMVDVPLWFLPGLFFTKIIHSVLQLIFKNNTLYYLLSNVLIIGIVIFLKNINIDLLFSLDSALLAFPFFAIGYVLKNKNTLKPMEQMHKKHLLIFMVLATIGYIILVLTVPVNGRIDINSCNYGKNILLFYIIGMIGIISTIFLSLLYTHHRRIITIISNGTIIIMAFHRIITSIVFRIIGLRGEDIIINPIIGSIVAIINVLIFIIPIIIVNKYIPILAGNRKSTPKNFA